MFPDIRFEADFLRAALLAGLIRELDVHAWAEALLAAGRDDGGLLADVVVARAEPTALREALRPLAEPADPVAAGEAVMSFLALDPAAAAMSVPNRLRVLSLLRREGLLTLALSAEVKLLEDRLMLAVAGVHPEHAPTDGELDRWITGVRPTAFFRVSPLRDEERMACLGALSRKVVRDRRWHPVAPAVGARAWIVRSGGDAPPSLVLNETLWAMAAREFSPLPLGSRIPYAGLLPTASIVLDEVSADRELVAV